MARGHTMDVTRGRPGLLANTRLSSVWETNDASGSDTLSDDFAFSSGRDSTSMISVIVWGR